MLIKCWPNIVGSNILALSGSCDCFEKV